MKEIKFIPLPQGIPVASSKYNIVGTSSDYACFYDLDTGSEKQFYFSDEKEGICLKSGDQETEGIISTHKAGKRIVKPKMTKERKSEFVEKHPEYGGPAIETIPDPKKGGFWIATVEKDQNTVMAYVDEKLEIKKMLEYDRTISKDHYRFDETKYCIFTIDDQNNMIEFPLR